LNKTVKLKPGFPVKSKTIHPAGILSLAIVLIVFSPNLAVGQVMEFEPDLKKYMAEGLKNNPDLESWQNRVEASQHALPQAGAWSDPTISLGFMNLPVNSLDFNREPMTGIWINVGQ